MAAAIVTGVLLTLFPLPAQAQLLARFSRPNAEVDWNATYAANGRPDLAAEANGTLHVVWTAQETSGTSVYYSRSTDEGASWSDTATISVPGFSPSVAVDQSGGPVHGTVYVAYEAYAVGSWVDRDVFVVRSADGGRSWSPPVRADHAPDGASVSSRCPDLAVGRDGVVFAIFADDRASPGSWAIYATHSSDGGATWGPDMMVSTYSAILHCPALRVDDLGRLYVSWTSLALPRDVFVARSLDGGSSWTVRVVASGNAEVTIHGSGIAMDPGGSVYAAWSATNRSTQDRGGVFVSRSDDGQTWTAPVNATHGGYTFYATFPAGVYAGPPAIEYLAGEVYVFWSGNRSMWLRNLDPFELNNDLDLYFAISRDRGGTWIGDDRVDDLNGGPGLPPQIFPSVSRSRYGIHAVWLDSRLGGGLYAVYYAGHSIEGLLVTEIVDSPPTGEYVEIFSQSHEARPLAGHRLVVDGLEVPLDPLDQIGPDEHVLVGPCAACDLQVPSLDLPEQGGTVALLDASGRILDDVRYGQRGPVPDPIASESVARFWTGEKYVDEWTRSPPTPGAYNTAGRLDLTGDVVLAEVHLNRTEPIRSFIEVYYRGTGAHDMAGFTLAGNGIAPLPSIVLDSDNRGFAVTGQDEPTFFGALDPGADNLYLYNARGDLVDASGWSSPIPENGSLARLPKTASNRPGFDDASSLNGGWLRLPVATLPGIALESDRAGPVPSGGCAPVQLSVANRRAESHTVDFRTTELEPGVTVGFLASDGVTPLVDTNENGLVDVGSVGPGISVPVVASLCVSPSAPSRARAVAFALSSDDRSGDAVLLEASMIPGLRPAAYASPTSFYVEGSPPFYPTMSTMDISVEGVGGAGLRQRAQDVVVLLDASGSIGRETFQFAKNATAAYIDKLSPPDRVAIFYFWEETKLVSTLTGDYELAKERLDFLQYLPFVSETSLGEAIVSVLDELLWNANASHERLVVLLTDGRHTMGALYPDAAATYAWQNRTRVFPVGLCTDSLCRNVDSSTLAVIARNSNASYYLAWDQQDLGVAYDAILGTMMDVLSDVAGYDGDPSDGSRMVKLAFPADIHIRPATFVDPETGAPRPPDFADPETNTFEWNVDRIKLGQAWRVSFQLTSSKTGLQIGLLPSSRVLYTNRSGGTIAVPFNEVWLNVTAPVGPATRLAVGEPMHVAAKTFVASRTPLTLEATDFSGTGIAGTWYSVDGGAWVPYDSAPFFLQGEGVWRVRYYSADVAGMREAPKETELTVDDSPPGVTPSLAGPAHASALTYVTSQTEITFVSQDRGPEPSGLASATYRAFLGGTWGPWTDFAPFSLGGPDGAVFVETVALDNLGNREERNWTFVLDNSPPETTLQIGRPAYGDPPTFVTSGTALTLAAADRGTPGSGLSVSEYRIWEGAWSSWLQYDSAFRLAGEGSRYVQFRSTDHLGNTEVPHNVTVFVDNTPPETRTTAPVADEAARAWSITLAATDAGSGVARSEYSIDGAGWQAYAGPLRVPQDGPHTVAYRSVDNLGNTEDVRLLSLTPEVPGERPEERMPNYKPLVALTFALILAIEGAWASRRAPWRVAKGALTAFALISLPFVFLEGATGVVSLLTGLLAIPPLLGAGMAVDLGILLAGIAISVYRVLKWTPPK